MPSRDTGRRGERERSRATQCGGKGGGPNYDPQVGQAAKQNADNAAQAQKWSQDYYTNTVSPLLAQETAASRQTQAQQQSIYALDMAQANKSAAEDNTYGVPARAAYYKMATDYSSQAEQERQATSAIGDMRTAEASNAGTRARQQASVGIDPTSGVAQAQSNDAGIQNTAAEAAAATRARYNAKTMGMQLTADAANYARGGQSAIPGYAGSAGNASSAGFGAASGATGSANQSGAIPMDGFRIAGQGYASNLDAYAGLQRNADTLQAQADGGLGGFLGTLGGIAMKAIPFSDSRLKHNLVRVGTGPHNLPLYEFSYLGSDRRYVGHLAQDVEKVVPAAVIMDPSGYRRVDYSMLEA